MELGESLIQRFQIPGQSGWRLFSDAPLCWMPGKKMVKPAIRADIDSYGQLRGG
jgi:hypothetical protein